ncbi:CyP450 monooxygenase [Thelephora ganbajun]|uniref:CyP450 monooxygenase n=1 Tax=Thelephora ganbajun TaxID=370292 RepID=A0ACB6Z7M0_THEGA|nr:CyP450 monooxygenase [Thelephora ganbajun]
MSIPEKYAGPTLAVIVTAIALAVARKKWASKHSPYPPGPKGYPIIGNLFDSPENPMWEGLTKMAKEYDTNILHLNTMGSHLVVLNNSDVAADLLERRSVIYSDRPRLPMVNELMGCSWSFVLMPYGSTWRRHRKLFHRFFNIPAVDQFDDKIYKAVDVFLRRLSESPERFLNHARFLSCSLTLSVSYGVNVESENDKFYSLSEDAMRAVDVALVPGAFLVDALPVLKYVPEWFPGAGFKRIGRIAKENLDRSINLPFRHVKESFEVREPYFSSSGWLTGTNSRRKISLLCHGIDEEAIRGAGGAIFLGGEETTTSIIMSFFLAATLNPEVVRLAQQEMDEVLGGVRLPDVSDRPRLPYTSAVVKEVLRWRPPNPLGTPHRLMEDDTYNGLLIPAGATVMDNVWYVCRRCAVTNRCILMHTFKPDRFLKDGQINPDVRDPEQLLFGWGRRICPGRHFAARVLFMTIARTLATFDISKCLDEDGNPIVPDAKYTHGFISYPLPFRSDIKPRSTQALSLVPGH